MTWAARNFNGNKLLALDAWKILDGWESMGKQAHPEYGKGQLL